MILIVADDCYAAMIGHVQSVYPKEGCGLLAGSQGRIHAHYPIVNTLNSPTAYLMDSQEQIRAMLEIEQEGWELLAIYHSHPNSDPYPSKTDVAAAAYPDAVHIIVSLQDETPAVSSFLIQNGLITPVSLAIS